MRTTLFLSTLFAVTLVGGAALADGSDSPAKAPRVIDRLRSKGDIVDKSYRGADKSSPAAAQAAAATNQARETKNRFDKASSRINCSEMGADCSVARPAATKDGAPAAAPLGDRSVRRPAFLDKVLGSDRTNFNEAGEDQGMSPRAANRAWSRAAAKNAGEGSKPLTLTTKSALPRELQQRSSARMSCNEGDECVMSSKEVKKVWAYDQIKKGIWTGPDAPAKQPSELAVERMKKEQAAKK